MEDTPRVATDEDSHAAVVPFVSVVIPTWNRWPFVAEAIDSVLSQDYANLECIVVDDASSDGTADLLAGRYGGAIRILVNDENQEKSASRNRGVLEASGEYVCLLDSDDRLTAGSVSNRMRVFLSEAGFDGISYGHSIKAGSTARARTRRLCVSGDVLDAYVRRRFVDNNGFIVSRRNMLLYGMYKPDLTHREDVELIVRLAARFPFRYCGNAASETRRLDQSARVQWDEQLAQGHRLIEHLRADPLVRERLGTQITRLEFAEELELARAAYKKGDLSEFRRRFQKALQSHPMWALRSLRFMRRYLVSQLHR